MDEIVDLSAGVQEDPAFTLDALIAEPLEPLFRRPTRVGVDSAWYGHLPFAAWVVRAARPRVLVELGTHAGVSYAAFCEAVLHEQLDTRCYAVDHWQGDEHAGFYGEQVYADLLAFHNARYGGFSRLLRGSFDEALALVADGTVDLLHIDGRHRYDDVAHDFASWISKLSPRAVVLLHDTNVRERDFGVWRFWAELQSQYPAFEFLHAHGLGVLAVGAEIPSAVRALCRDHDPARVGLLRERFAVLGERWALLQEISELRRALSDQAPGAGELAGLRTEVEALKTRQATLVAARRSLALQLAEARNQAVVAVEPPSPEPMPPAPVLEVPAPPLGPAPLMPPEPPPVRAVGVLSWRDRLRPGAMRLPPDIGSIAVPPEAPTEPDEPAASEPPDPRPRILFISGEPTTPGHQYRVVHAMQLAEAAGWRADWSEVAPVGPHTLAGAKLVVLWRVPWSTHVQGIFDACEEIGARVLFDVDDLVFRPELARIEVIDGIRTTDTTESSIGSFFAMINRALDMSELTTCTTEELAQQIRAIGRPATVLPNGFDSDAHALARLSVRRRAAGRGWPDPDRLRQRLAHPSAGFFVARRPSRGGAARPPRRAADRVPRSSQLRRRRPPARISRTRRPRGADRMA